MGLYDKYLLYIDDGEYVIIPCCLIKAIRPSFIFLQERTYKSTSWYLSYPYDDRIRLSITSPFEMYYPGCSLDSNWEDPFDIYVGEIKEGIFDFCTKKSSFIEEANKRGLGFECIDPERIAEYFEFYEDPSGGKRKIKGQERTERVDYSAYNWYNKSSNRQGFSSSIISSYKILGLSENADIPTIKKTYRQLSKIYHPDMPTGNSDHFKKIAESYRNIKQFKGFD